MSRLLLFVCVVLMLASCALALRVVRVVDAFAQAAKAATRRLATSTLTAAAARAMCIGTCLVLASPCITMAEQGQEANIVVFRSEDTSSIGDSIYDDADKAVIRQKAESISKVWNKMEKRVASDIEKGNKLDALGQISSYMGQLKSDMRLVSKAACGGDIFERSDLSIGDQEGKNVAKFDYTTGKFSYKPIAAKAESVIATVNDLYFYSIDKADTESALKEFEATSAVFDEWYAMVEKAI